MTQQNQGNDMTTMAQSVHDVADHLIQEAIKDGTAFCEANGHSTDGDEFKIMIFSACFSTLISSWIGATGMKLTAEGLINMMPQCITNFMEDQMHGDLVRQAAH